MKIKQKIILINNFNFINFNYLYKNCFKFYYHFKNYIKYNVDNKFKKAINIFFSFT